MRLRSLQIVIDHSGRPRRALFRTELPGTSAVALPVSNPEAQA